MTLTIGATVEENIFNDIINTLGAIDGLDVGGGIGWNTPFRKVRAIEGDVMNDMTLPQAGVYHAGTPATFEPSKMQKRAVFHIILAHQAQVPSPTSSIMRMIADAETALHQTYTRGGLARDTRVVHSEIVPRTSEDYVIVATMTVEVVFAHPHGDPTTAS